MKIVTRYVVSMIICSFSIASAISLKALMSSALCSAVSTFLMACTIYWLASCKVVTTPVISFVGSVLPLMAWTMDWHLKMVF